MNFEIHNRWSGAVQYECELSAEAENWPIGLRLGFAVKAALKSGANLRGADLHGADLGGADLHDADLRDVDLRGANLHGADLHDADLGGADLRGADLHGVRADMIAEILKLPNELEFLRAALAEGRVDGSTYSGDCACLAGTLARAKGIERYTGEQIDANGTPFIADVSSPRESFFTAIRRGDTPETNAASKIALEWVEEAIAIRDHIRKTAPKVAL